jgi:transposase
MTVQYHLGVDLHQKWSYWTLMNDKKDVLYQGKVPTTEKDTRSALALLPVPAREVQAAIEPVSQWGWYAEVLEKEGVSVKLADALKAKLIASSKLKNDKVDSRTLAELLRTDFLPTAYLAPRETRELREFLRWRQFTVRLRTKCKNRIHSILWKHGLRSPGTDLFGKKARVWLEKQPLNPVFKDELASLLRMIESLGLEAKTLDEEISRRVSIDDEAKTLMTMPGVGPYTALLIQAEVGDFKRFNDPKKLGSYAGLVSSTRSSGEKMRFGNITRQGSHYLRTAMVEAATRIRPKHGDLSAFFSRIKEKKGPKVARVALARKMLVALWFMVHRKEPFRARLGDSGGVKR